jgi:galactokinase
MPTKYNPNFSSLFDKPFDISTSAPGRVNLMGDHTDYNGGYVLPSAIPLKTSAEMAKTQTMVVRVWSDEVYQKQPEHYVLGKESPQNNWLDYIQGISFVLRQDDHPLGGFDLKLSTNIPLGSGLSSSAALEISILKGLREVFHLNINDIKLAQLGQKAETDFVGAPVGIMDQMASCLAKENSALFLDTRTLSYEHVPLPNDCELVIIDSGISHHHATGGYKQRRKECHQACELLNVKFLTDLSVHDLEMIAQLPSPINRRVRHVILENERVKETVSALKNHNLGKLRELFYASHKSLSMDFEVSTPEIDALIEAASVQKNIIGGRLTGGGFGGSIVLLAYKNCGHSAALEIIKTTKQKIKFSPRVILP